MLRDAGARLGLRRIVAITALDNERSAQLLQKLGFHVESLIPYPGEDEPVRLFGCALDAVDDTATQP